MHNANLVKYLIMKKINFLTKILLIYLFSITVGFTEKSDSFDKGILLFNEEEFDKSKIFFERDIVFNPKNAKSYLYLAKIFNKSDNDFEEEINLDNVLLLDPQNDEAVYMLIILKIEQSDYGEAKQLIKRFDLVCKSFCLKKKEIQIKFDKLIPENEENNN